MMQKLLVLCFALLLSFPAYAGSGTIAVTPGSGATIATTTDGSSNNLPHNVMCDYSAGANCQSVDSSHNASVIAAASTNTIGATRRVTFSATCSTLTLPNTTGTYAVGQIVANNTTAGSVTAQTCVIADYSGGPISITRATLISSDITSGITNGAFELELYTLDPALSTGILSGNGVAYSTKLGGWFCSVPVTLTMNFTDFPAGNGAPAIGSDCSRVLSGTQTIYMLMMSKSTFVWHNNATFQVILEGYN